MKRTKLKIAFAFMFVLVTVSSLVYATTVNPLIDSTKTGSLTITTYEQNNGSTATDVPISGVTYALYKVGDYNTSTGEIDALYTGEVEDYIKGKTAVGTQTTGTDGKATFSNLALGRYYADVTSYPTGTSQVPQSFLVDIPTTDASGTGWNYNVTANPKIQTITKAVVVTKTDEAGNVMEGVKFKAMISTDDGATWTDYMTDLETGSNGKFSLSDLPTTYETKAAKYKLIETETNTGYIIDNANPTIIQVTTDGKVMVNNAEDGDDLVVTSGADGYVTIKGLAYEDNETAKTYYLVETETPTYTDDNGEVKHYTLANKPIAFQISGTSQDSEILVVNKKQLVLPLTGGIGAIAFVVAGVAIFFVAKNMKKAKQMVQK